MTHPEKQPSPEQKQAISYLQKYQKSLRISSTTFFKPPLEEKTTKSLLNTKLVEGYQDSQDGNVWKVRFPLEASE